MFLSSLSKMSNFINRTVSCWPATDRWYLVWRGLKKRETAQGNETEKLRIWTQTSLNLFKLSCCSSLDEQVKDRDVKLVHPGPYGVSGEGAGRTPAERPPLDPGSAPSSSGSSSSPAGRWRPRAGSASGRCGWGCSHRGHGPGGFSTHRTKTKCVIEIHILLFTKIQMVQHLKQPRLVFCRTPGSSRRADESLSLWECRWAVGRDSWEQFL